MKTKLLPLSIALVSLGHTFPALAQTATEHDVLEEITVTATKRETSLMETPIAITAFTAEDLARQGLTNVKDLGDHTPGLSIGMEAAHNAPVISMRGIRSTNSTTIGDPAVGLHLDGIYQPRPQSATALMFDVERVEVLRGPQGTLFGRNSTVGTINVISAKPDFEEFDASVDVQLGRWNNRQLRGMINIPVSDTLAIRGSFFQGKRDSYLKGYYDPNQYDVRQLGGNDFINNAPVETDPERFQSPWWSGGAGHTPRQVIKADEEDFYNNVDQYAFRLSALWQPTEKLSWMLSYEQFQDDGAGSVFQNSCDDAAKRSDTDPGTTCEELFGHDDNQTVYVGTPGEQDISIQTLRSNFSWDLSDSLRLVYNAGMTQMDRDSVWDFDQGTNPWDQQMAFKGLEMDSFSHEVQLQSTDDGPLQWIAGLYYFEEESDGPGYWMQSINQVEFWDSQKQISQSQAVFAQTTFDATDKLHLTLGLRYTEDKRSTDGGNYRCNSSNGCYPGWMQRSAVNDRTGDYYFDLFEEFAANGYQDNGTYTELGIRNNKGEWSDTTYRVGVDYDLTDDTMIYAYVANGYKAGGFTAGVTDFDGNPVDTNYDPEQVVTYEVGVKTSLLDSTLNLSANYFFSDYKDQQISRPVTVDERVIGSDPITGDPITETITPLLTANAKRSEIQGVELEFDWIPWANGRFSGFATWMKSEITEDTITKWNHLPGYMFGHLPTPVRNDNLNEDLYVNLKGNELPFNPEWTLTLKYEHNFDMPFGGVLTPFVSFHWEDEAYMQIWNVDKHLDMPFDSRINPLSVTDKRDSWYKVDASVKYTSADENWYLEAFVNNATDEETIKYQKQNSSITRGSYELPRFYGLRMGYNF